SDPVVVVTLTRVVARVIVRSRVRIREVRVVAGSVDVCRWVYIDWILAPTVRQPCLRRYDIDRPALWIQGIANNRGGAIPRLRIHVAVRHRPRRHDELGATLPIYQADASVGARM